MAKTDTIADLSDVFLRCRTVGHAWEEQVVYLDQHGRRPVHRAVWLCERETVAGIEDASWKEVLSWAKGSDAGTLLEAPRYHYADGYQVAEHVGRGRHRPVARLELMERLAVPAPKEVTKDDGRPRKGAHSKAARSAASHRRVRQPTRRRR